MTPVVLGPGEQGRHRFVASWLRSVRGRLLIGLVLVVVTVALYYPVNSHPFANYDDPDYVTDNFHVKSGLHWSTVTVGLHDLCRRQLASLDLALACRGCSVLSARCRPRTMT